jgi:hypothetical protein
MDKVQSSGNLITPTESTRFMLTVAGPGSRLFQIKDSFKAVCLELDKLNLSIPTPTHEQTTYLTDDVAVSLYALEI